MPLKICVICCHEFGPAETVACLEERELPALGPAQALVGVKAAPINPADINYLEGKYGIRPDLPAIPGNESAGIVIRAGEAVKSLKIDDQVIAPGRIGSWCEAYVADTEKLIIIPKEIPPEQAAFLSVNAPTAWALLESFVNLSPGDWVVQNAANSTVGRFIIQIAKARGLKTLNVVRRAELIEELKTLGADIVVTDETPVSKKVQELTAGAEIRLGVNAVGGESARELAKSLGRHGTLVTIGAMGREPLQVPNALLIFKDIRFRGLWINEWFQAADRATIERMYGELISLMSSGKLKAPVEKVYELSSYREAIQDASRGGRRGKIMFKMDAS